MKKIKLSSLEPVAQHRLNLGAGEQRGIENVVFRNAPAVVVPVPAPAPAMGSVQSYAPTTTAASVPPPVIIIEEPRQPPPAGQPILKRLPTELVGDLLQVCISNLHLGLRILLDQLYLLQFHALKVSVQMPKSSPLLFIQSVYFMT